jgi:hypothetical protein
MRCSSTKRIKQHSDRAVPFTHNLTKNEGQKISKYETSALKIKTIWKLNNVSAYSSVYSGGVVTKKILSGAKSSYITNMSYSTQIPNTRTCPLTLGYG